MNLNLLQNWGFFFDGFLVVHYWDILFDQNCCSVVLTSDCRCTVICIVNLIFSVDYE